MFKSKKIDEELYRTQSLILTIKVNPPLRYNQHGADR
jgi:hypothetical protein